MTTCHRELPRTTLGALLAAAVLFGSRPASSYPLDGGERLGIRRLTGYRNAQDSEEKRIPRLKPGALLGVDDIRLGLEGNPDWDTVTAERDPELQAALDSVFKARDPSYGVAVVDISDPEHPAWAAVREDVSYVPQSVGKVLVMIGLFDALKRAFPDTADRLRILHDTRVKAASWIVRDSHTVPHFDGETGRNQFRPIQLGEEFNLAEWIDHMVSPSANAAGSTVWKEAMLLRHFGDKYPVDARTEEEFFKSTPKSELGELALKTLEDPLLAAGIDTSKVRQATMYTRTGQSKVPGSRSYASPGELVRVLLRIEQGRMIDAWSSLEMKRFLYFTKKRYRYAYAPELDGSAVYFKSGSYYKCVPEEGYHCGKYKGNAENVMNSVAIVETPARHTEGQKRYLVALMSNVLRKNSAWDHARLAAAIEEAIQTRAAVKVKEEGTSGDISSAGAAQ